MGEQERAYESPDAAAARIIQEVRRTTSRLPFVERAGFLRELVKASRDAVKFDPLLGGAGPVPPDWELVEMGSVGDAAENYYMLALEADLRAQGRLT